MAQRITKIIRTVAIWLGHAQRAASNYAEKGFSMILYLYLPSAGVQLRLTECIKIPVASNTLFSNPKSLSF